MKKIIISETQYDFLKEWQRNPYSINKFPKYISYPKSLEKSNPVVAKLIYAIENGYSCIFRYVNNWMPAKKNVSWRWVDPHVIGNLKKGGNLVLRGYQTLGHTATQKEGWKLFLISNITNITIYDGKDNPTITKIKPRDKYNPNDKQMFTYGRISVDYNKLNQPTPEPEPKNSEQQLNENFLKKAVIGTALISSILAKPEMANQIYHNLHIKDLNTKIAYNDLFENYYDVADKYLSRNIFKNSPIKPEMLVKSAKQVYDKYGILIPIELVLAQGQIETKLGQDGRKKNYKTNPFNVGEYDNKTKFKFDSLQQGIDKYYQLLAIDYFEEGKRDLDNLLKNFVNKNNKRYASDINYEAKLKQIIKFIKNYIKK